MVLACWGARLLWNGSTVDTGLVLFLLERPAWVSSSYIDIPTLFEFFNRIFKATDTWMALS